jgi:hypothetical protein
VQQVFFGEILFNDVLVDYLHYLSPDLVSVLLHLFPINRSRKGPRNLVFCGWNRDTTIRYEGLVETSQSSLETVRETEV